MIETIFIFGQYQFICLSDLLAHPLVFLDIAEAKQEDDQTVNVFGGPAESHIHAQVHDGDIDVKHIDTEGDQFQKEGGPCVSRSGDRLEEYIAQRSDERRGAEHP